MATRTRIEEVDISTAIRDSYLNYALSVVIGRAVPDVRDGLKPVQRRILYTMHEMKLGPNSMFRKSARVVGEVMGKYHPHGDAPIYEALVRMAQDFNMRYPLVEGQGNFGSVDGDEPAAMRYTEVRMAKIATDMLADIDKDTVDFVPNFDQTLKEPAVLPTRVPNLLINGAVGIAVGMATFIPPHNLSEVVDALVFVLDSPLCMKVLEGMPLSEEEFNALFEGIMERIKGPDFPTGGEIVGDVKEIYRNGTGRLAVRAKVKVTKGRKGKSRIEVFEIPYQTSKAGILERIARLVEKKELEGIVNLRDETDRRGMKIVIEVDPKHDPHLVLKKLLKSTPLQASYRVEMLALVNNTPRVLSIVDILSEFLRFREEVVVRRTRFELARAKERLHILEGILKALVDIDTVIKVIRESRTVKEAKENLQIKIGVTPRQADAILEIRLQRLVGMERLEVEREIKRLRGLIEEWETILKDRGKRVEIIKRELLEVKERYGDARKTGFADEEDLEIPVTVSASIFAVTERGYIKRMAVDDLGRKQTTLVPKDDRLVQVIWVPPENDALIILDTGNAFRVQISGFPKEKGVDRGRLLADALGIKGGREIGRPVAVVPWGKPFIIVSAKGVCALIKDFVWYKVRGSKPIALPSKDRVVAAIPLPASAIFILTNAGRGMRVKVEGIPLPDGAKRGVLIASLRIGEEIVSATPADREWLVVISERGYAKKMEAEAIPLHRRGTKPVACVSPDAKSGPFKFAVSASEADVLFVATDAGTGVKVPIQAIRKMGRTARGSRAVVLGEGERILSVVRVG